jgi:hypothetical protein
MGAALGVYRPEPLKGPGPFTASSAKRILVARWKRGGRKEGLVASAEITPARVNFAAAGRDYTFLAT